MSDSFALLARNKLAFYSGICLALIVLVALAAPLLPLQDPAATALANKLQPLFSPGHWLGTDQLGRDVLSRLVWGTRLSLWVGLSAALAAALLGATLGIVAGYFGQRVDNIVMRGIDMLMAFPYILLALAIVAALGPGLGNALIAVTVVNIPFFARNIRGVTRSLAEREFIDAARLSGSSDWQIIRSELLPNLLPMVVVAMSTTIGWMILETAGLSFLGLGSQPPQADLGAMLGAARNTLITSPHVSLVVGATIFVIVMCINLLGDGVRDVLDPRLKSGALSRPAMRTHMAADYQPPEPVSVSPQALLDVDRLHTRFEVKGRVYQAVNGVSLQVAPGECLGVIGESGSGKSVSALSVMGLVASPPGVIGAGDIRFGGQSLLSVDDEQLRQLRGGRVAYIFQDPLATLHPLYRIGEQLIEAMAVHRRRPHAELRAKAVELLAQVRIPNPEQRLHCYPHELSGGMRQRVSIAMALANEPELIIADEPTTALDVTVQAQILALLDQLRRERNMALMFITHDFGVVAQLCERVAVMYAGKVVESGPTERVLARPAHPYTRRLIACVPEPGQGKRALQAIQGLPPAVDRLPPGCAFAERCDRAEPLCHARPPSSSAGRGRQVLCHFPEVPLRQGASDPLASDQELPCPSV